MAQPMETSREADGPRHFLDISDVPAADLHAMIDEAVARKRARQGWPQGRPDADQPLKDHIVALLFEKPSTRTRFSFDVGVRQLGGQVMTFGTGDMQLGRGETIEDTARVLSGFVDAVMIRANRDEHVEAFAHAGSIPVINGLTDWSHPCQIMADVMTLKDHFGALEGLKVAWLGDGNNVSVSFIQAAEAFGFDLALACPDPYRPSEAAVADAQAAGAAVSVLDDPMEAASGADVIVADTFVSMGDTDADQRLKDLIPYQVNSTIMAQGSDRAVFLHCLPAHRGEEVTAEVIDGPRSLVWQEAENRLHAQKAILTWCLGQ